MNDTTPGIGLPGGKRVSPFPYLSDRLAEGSLGSIISEFMIVVMYIAGFLSFIWFAWGVFEYIFAGGGKEGLGKARKRMTWAIVGFIIFVLSFALSQYVQTIFPTNSSLRDVREVAPVNKAK